ncbi:hypothetical protein Sgou_25800 [Streptomyces gougerotii]|uniref:Uncharacterized protein n=1 Tax=Streptomyces gougerotii TaxID=53448 RepID=A0A8H9HQI5_9ACTN|nr:hypothetical protein Sgou_25800 [Streptomyces gougerotii]GGU81471.1 hypothetical protein GCM10010227_39610 [Streptomyces gougerotii]
MAADRADPAHGARAGSAQPGPARLSPGRLSPGRPGQLRATDVHPSGELSLSVTDGKLNDMPDNTFRAAGSALTTPCSPSPCSSPRSPSSSSPSLASASASGGSGPSAQAPDPPTALFTAEWPLRRALDWNGVAALLPSGAVTDRPVSAETSPTATPTGRSTPGTLRAGPSTNRTR